MCTTLPEENTAYRTTHVKWAEKYEHGLPRKGTKEYRKKTN